MTRLIDADALLATLPNYESYKDVIDIITNAPTVQREATPAESLQAHDDLMCIGMRKIIRDLNKK